MQSSPSPSDALLKEASLSIAVIVIAVFILIIVAWYITATAFILLSVSVCCGDEVKASSSLSEEVEMHVLCINVSS